MASLKLKKAATLTLRDMLGLYEDETVLVISDEKMRDVGMAFLESAKKLAEEAYYVEIPVLEANDAQPPDIVSKIMKMVDLVVCPTTRPFLNTKPRRDASELGVRIVALPGVDVEMLSRCANAEHDRIIELTEKIKEVFENSSIVRVETESGTDITMPMKGREIFGNTGIFKTISDFGAIPGGEVYFSPWEDKTNGIIVADGTIGELGIVKNAVTIEISDGFARKIIGDGEEQRKFARIINKAGDEARALAGFGVGTNYKATMTGNIYEDVTALGTANFSFGNNLHLGGMVDVPLHLNAVIQNPDIYCDDEIIMKEGKFVV